MLFRTVLGYTLFCAAIAATTMSTAAAATVEVRVSGVAAGKGKVNVAVCDRERFLKQCSHSGSAPAKAAETVVTLKDVPPGTWAVLAYQDENENNELDRNFIGIPSENYGFSRNARGKFGPPGFEDAAIEVGGDRTVAPVTLK
jgi:uncharacterized protein (DUF2141 family)